MNIKFRRVLLKISGESLMGNLAFGIDPIILSYISDQIKTVVELGVQLSIVIGGGNIFRGVKNSISTIERSSADHMGMLATVINSLALQGILVEKGIDARVQTAIPMNDIAEPYVLRRALNHLDKGRVVIFAAGLGNPYFTTDTAAVLRARETYSEVLLKATKVDFLYDCDPEIKTNATPINSIRYMEVITRQLKVMDMTAISLAMEGSLPLIIFNIKGEGNFKRILCGEKIGTDIIG